MYGYLYKLPPTRKRIAMWCFGAAKGDFRVFFQHWFSADCMRHLNNMQWGDFHHSKRPSCSFDWLLFVPAPCDFVCFRGIGNLAPVECFRVSCWMGLNCRSPYVEPGTTYVQTIHVNEGVIHVNEIEKTRKLTMPVLFFLVRGRGIAPRVCCLAHVTSVSTKYTDEARTKNVN